MTLSGIKPKRVGDTLFIRLPSEMRLQITGGCNCPYCKDHPLDAPRWDTLAIDAKAKSHTWIVHFPDLN